MPPKKQVKSENETKQKNKRHRKEQGLEGQGSDRSHRNGNRDRNRNAIAASAVHSAPNSSIFVRTVSISSMQLTNEPYKRWANRHSPIASVLRTRSTLTLQPLLFWRKEKKARENPEKRKGFSLCGTPKIHGKERKSAPKKQGKSEKSKENRKKQGLEGQGTLADHSEILGCVIAQAFF